MFCEYDGVIEVATDKAIGIAHEAGGEIEFWLPRSQIERITYVDGGDSEEIEKGKAIEAVEIPSWLANEKGLG